MVLPMRSRNKEKSPYITLEEACKLLEISVATGRNWLKLEKIKYYANVLKKPVNYIKAMVKGIIKDSPEVRWTDKEAWF